MLRGHEVWTSYSDSFPRVTCPFLRKISVMGAKVCPRMKFSWFEFVGHEVGIKTTTTTTTKTI